MLTLLWFEVINEIMFKTVPQLLGTQSGHELSPSSKLFWLEKNFKGCKDLDAYLTPQARILAGNLLPKYLISPVSGLLQSNLHFHDESTESTK